MSTHSPSMLGIDTHKHTHVAVLLNGVAAPGRTAVPRHR